MLKFENLSRTIRNLHAATELVKSTGESTESVFDIDDNFRGSPQMRACVERVRAIPEARAMMEERYMGPEVDIDALLKLPRGTLGHTYATVLTTLGYDPNFYRRREIKSDEDWVTMRSRKTHDILHVITGFGPTGGELGVLAIGAVQISAPTAVFLEVVSLGAALKQFPQRLAEVTSQAARGMAIALEAKPLIAQRWEEGWDKPVSQWRQELNITHPVIDEPYSLKNRLSHLDLDW
jgi:ubiquinone biosynthesis protein COQ4